ncbi:beta-N-acetylhexosaminidase [Gluconobacter morbifer]|uniref:N-acetyl-beta-glucosaminidase n=1 Tax=Gluconobacter morbifer G707 TaxID=1088869 RepID=G6XEX4_9PROT|nr:family 20 glycosylhydrolase [Gluconobacter morbifer]EHH68732.1 N-acetyl-beta-hexosaminidase [Gluconobacter morbifer G707]
MKSDKGVCLRNVLPRVLALSVTALTALSGFAAPVHAGDLSAPALMPVPKSVHLSDGAIPLQDGLTVVWDTEPSALLKRAASRFVDRLDRLAGRIQPVPVSSTWPGGTPATLHVRFSPDADFLSVKAKEGYTLSVDAGQVSLVADGPEGVLRGMSTILQLVQNGRNGAQLDFAQITDSPRFPWRGIMIDTSRHFMTIETLRRQLDAMELLKLNVLHLHLSDGTGFRVESHVLPELTAKGSHGQYYTQAQMRDLVAYARDRGIRIVPEFDVPGHALALLLARPELAAQSPVNPVAKNLNTAAFDPTLPETLHVIRELYGEMGKLFPDHYFHSGGDEVNPKEWVTNLKIVAYMKAHHFDTPQALQAAFTAQVEKILSTQGKVMVGWDEVSEAPIPKTVVVEPWRSSKFTASATAAGHPVIVSVGYYLDLLQPAAQHYLVDPYDPAAVGVNRADAKRMISKGMDPVLVNAFLIDPPPPPLNDAQKQLVLGGEAPLWSEVVTDEMLDGRFWPRAAAIAERFWSAADVRDVPDMYRRLNVVGSELEQTGLKARSNAARMAERLSPADPSPVETLAEATVPLRNYAMNRYVEHHDKTLDAIGEIVSPDPAAAIRFNELAARYAQGDHALAGQLRAMLQGWVNNDAAFSQVAVAAGLAPAVPVAHDVAVLAQMGLDALAHPHRKMPEASLAVLKNWTTVLSDSDNLVKAASGKLESPAGLMIAIVPGIHALCGE